MTSQTAESNNEQPVATGLPQGAVDRLIACTEKLTRIIREEIGILEARRPAEIAPLQAEKARLSTEYAKECDFLKGNKCMLGDQDSPLRRRLREATRTMNSELVRLGRILLRMKSVTEGMVQSIAEEVSRRSTKLRNYSGDAEVTETAGGKPVPIALNEII